MIILSSILVTLNLFLLSKPSLAVAFQTPLISLSQLFSLLGTVLLSFSFILGSRAPILERWFGSLDKISKTHHLVGGFAFVLLINHPLLLAVNVLPNFPAAARYFWLSTDSTYNYGVIALYVMILVLLLTLVIKLPYHFWLKTHDFIGLTLFFACLHIFFISSDISRYLPLRIWIFFLLSLGIFSYIYKVFLYRWFGPKYKYTVKKTKQLGDIFEIYLSPQFSSLPFRPGQFAFINFNRPGLTESHPFSFSSPPGSPLLRFSVKVLGDYTAKLNQLTAGTPANIWGAYGQMYQHFSDDKDVVCVGGGIGITPFLSLIGHEVNHPQPRTIFLFYSAKSQVEAVYHAELSQLASTLKNFKYFPHFSDTQPRLTVDDIYHAVRSLDDRFFYLCGPKSMMDSLSLQLKNKGVPSDHIIFEDFTLKA